MDDSPNIDEAEWQPGQAPWRDTLHRLVRNRLAMAGIILLVAVLVPVLGAPLFTDADPNYQRQWLGAQPPGFSHPLVLAENIFTVGEAPGSHKSATAGQTLVFSEIAKDYDDYRLVLRRKKISSIDRLAGAVSLDTLTISAEDHAYELVLEDGSVLPIELTAALTVGERPPNGLFVDGERVAILRVQPNVQPTITTTVSLSDGLVTAITRDGKALDHIAISGAEVTACTLDGQPLLQYHLLGTDDSGRDLFSRVLYGGRISLMVGVVATFVSLLIGVLYGSISGYTGGVLDRVMMSGVDILYAIPFMFLVIILMVSFGRDLILLFVALGAVQWLTMARIVRGQVLSLKRKEYIEAARASGAGPVRILLRHLIPNAIGPVIVYTTLTIPIVILQESFLAFIGLAVQYKETTLDSWGALVNQGMQSLGSNGSHAWLLIAPSVAMALTLLALNCLGDGLRDVLDPRLSNS